MQNNGKPKRTPFDTTYFDEKTVRDGLSGCNSAVAIAIHRRMSWPIAVLWRDAYPDFLVSNHMVPAHVEHIFCVASNGHGVDIEGARPFAEIYERWKPSLRRDHSYSFGVFDDEKEYVTAMNDAEQYLVVPTEYAVEAAERVISKSPAFQQLLKTLRGETRKR
jgi:hypothetical protein